MITFVYNKKQSGETKEDRIDKWGVGAIAAVTFPDGKVKSAKIVKKSTRDRKLMVETSYGRKEIVGYDKVVWIKKHPDGKWPKGVLDLMKRNQKSVQEDRRGENNYITK